jgi:hypothetical protein
MRLPQCAVPRAKTLWRWVAGRLPDVADGTVAELRRVIAIDNRSSVEVLYYGPHGEMSVQVVPDTAIPAPAVDARVEIAPRTNQLLGNLFRHLNAPKLSGSRNSICPSRCYAVSPSQINSSSGRRRPHRLQTSFLRSVCVRIFGGNCVKSSGRSLRCSAGIIAADTQAVYVFGRRRLSKKLETRPIRSA